MLGRSLTIAALAAALAACSSTHPGPQGTRSAPPLEPVLETLDSAPVSVSAPPAVTSDETARLLKLTAEVINAPTPEQRKVIEAGQLARYQAASNYDNLLGLTMVRALIAASPEDLQAVRSDLQALSNGGAGLSASQRNLALLTLVMVDERLRIGNRITELENQIDSLTKIEESLNNTDLNGGTEQLP